MDDEFADSIFMDDAGIALSRGINFKTRDELLKEVSLSLKVAREKAIEIEK